MSGSGNGKKPVKRPKGPNDSPSSPKDGQQSVALAQVKEADPIIKGMGIRRSELRDWLRRRQEQDNTRPQFLQELYDKEDLSLVTETPPRMVIPKVRMKLILAAIDPTREKSLIAVWLEEYDKVMVSYLRQGRLEALGGMQALAAAEEQERAVSLGGGR